MTLTAWGLILDIVGVLLIATSTFGASVDKSGFLTMKRWLPATLSSWANPIGWLFLLVGFALQLAEELGHS